VSDDPVLEGLREQIAAVDLEIVAAMNERIRLVAEIKAHKESRGIGFVDPEREASLLRYLADANSGPLSDAGLRELFELILALSKREVS
jgi:chorismate mutase/prephenate dehydratase